MPALRMRRLALTQAARYLDQHMRDIRSTGKVMGLERVAIMAALNISHELLALKSGDNPSRDQRRAGAPFLAEQSARRGLVPAPAA